MYNFKASFLLAMFGLTLAQDSMHACIQARDVAACLDQEFRGTPMPTSYAATNTKPATLQMATMTTVSLPLPSNVVALYRREAATVQRPATITGQATHTQTTQATQRAGEPYSAPNTNMAAARAGTIKSSHTHLSLLIMMVVFLSALILC
ncbi:hypothetical protein SeLEV6574_g08275 [Synchytrium endobioticum]|uniref:Uncharacterized protein n=1 Tax=Synchytrium endobioticum TaxID=286115 RepID=A0A507CAQ7_9FUNG|nr:hypothetical protein SeLEV6574_g08275 [Synchytrium endobioticum]